MENLHDIFNIIVGVIIADLGVSWIRRYMKRRHMRKLNQLSQMKKRRKKEEVTKLIKETDDIVGLTYVRQGGHVVVGERRPLTSTETKPNV